MRLSWLALLFAARVDAAPARDLEVMPIVGFSAVGPPSQWSVSRSTLDGKATSPLLGISVGYESDPFTLAPEPGMTWRWFLGTFRWAPEVTLQNDVHHSLAFVGLRLGMFGQWTPERPDLPPILSDTLVLRVGVVDRDATALGLGWMTRYQFGTHHGFSFQFGANTWRDEQRGRMLQLTGSLSVMFR